MKVLAAFLVGVGALATVSLPGECRAQESRLDGLRASVKAAPADKQVALALGRALLRAGHVPEAEKQLRHALSLSSGMSKEGIEVRWELAHAALAAGEFRRAMAQCESLTVSKASAAIGHACAAEAHLLYRRGSEALMETDKALAASPHFFEAKLAEGLAKEFELRESEAESSLREAVSEKPDAWQGHLALGRLLVRAGKRPEGITELTKAVELDPDGPEAAYELGVTQTGDAAIASLRRAVRERSGYSSALLKLAGLELAAGHVPEAKTAAEAALKADGRSPIAPLVLGRASLIEGNADAAAQQAQAVLALVANSAAARLLLGEAYALKGEVDSAFEQFQTSYALDNNDPTPLLRGSEACLRLGRLTSSRAFAEKATVDFPHLAAGFVALGDTLIAENDRDGARAAYERALKADGDATVVDKSRVRSKLDALASRR